MRKSSSRSAGSRPEEMKVAVFNIGKILSGDLAAPVARGDTVVMAESKIVSVGNGGNVADCDIAIDAAGMMVMPGLIHSHVHIPFPHYTPPQNTARFLH